MILTDLHIPLLRFATPTRYALNWLVGIIGDADYKEGVLLAKSRAINSQKTEQTHLVSMLQRSAYETAFYRKSGISVWIGVCQDGETFDGGRFGNPEGLWSVGIFGKPLAKPPAHAGFDYSFAPIQLH